MNITSDQLKDWALFSALFSPVLTAAVMWWLSQRFAPKKETADAIEKMQTKLEAGEKRFAELDAAISAATSAAKDAKAAAEKALEAADEIGETKVDLEALRGDIKTLSAILARVERRSDLVTDGHLVLGKGDKL